MTTQDAGDNSLTGMLDLEQLDFDKGNGLVTVIAQDARSGVVLMLAHADREALERTIATGEMHYHSRSRGLWHKGATSGSTQRVVSLARDCDGDAILALVVPAGPACHVGSVSCFGATALNASAMSAMDVTIAQRKAAGTEDLSSYTKRLLADRNLRLKKVGEEAAEVVTACADADASRAAEEVADLIYHALVALHATGGSLADVQAILAARHG